MGPPANLIAFVGSTSVVQTPPIAVVAGQKLLVDVTVEVDDSSGGPGNAVTIDLVGAGVIFNPPTIEQSLPQASRQIISRTWEFVLPTGSYQISVVLTPLVSATVFQNRATIRTMLVNG